MRRAQLKSPRVALFQAFLALMVLTAPVPSTLAENVNVTWMASASSDVTGYRVYYGVTGSFTNQVVVANQTRATVTDLQKGLTYFFYATAFNSGGESDPSGVVT